MTYAVLYTYSGYTHGVKLMMVKLTRVKHTALQVQCSARDNYTPGDIRTVSHSHGHGVIHAVATGTVLYTHGYTMVIRAAL